MKPTDYAHCANCQTELHGKFCHRCGEQLLQPERDFSVLHFLTETFENFTHFDSKLLRSMAWLFVRPGFLTAEFLAGRRVSYLKPIPLFAMAGILFYFFFASATAFYSNLWDMNRGFEEKNRLSNTFQIDTRQLLAEHAAAAKMEPEACWQTLSPEASNRSKTWLFAVVPVWGLLLWGLLWWRMAWLVPYLIYALHGLTFFILFDLLMLLIAQQLLDLRTLGDGYTLFLGVAFIIYNSLAMRRVFNFGWLGSFLAGFGATFLFLIVILLYRQLMTVWVLS